MRLCGNQLTGTLPSGLATQLTSLVSLQLSGNHFSGPIPATWITQGVYPQLASLDLCRNDLTGVLPSGLNFLTNLTHVSLCQNGFTGFLPSAWSLLTNLQVLNVCENRLSGGVPSEWSVLLSNGMMYLSLCSNTLYGSLTDTLWAGAYTALEVRPRSLLQHSKGQRAVEVFHDRISK